MRKRFWILILFAAGAYWLLPAEESSLTKKYRMVRVNDESKTESLKPPAVKASSTIIDTINPNLFDLANEDQLCEVVKQQYGENGFSYPALSALWQKASATAEFDPLIREDGPLFGHFLESDNKIVNFYNALWLGGFLAGVNNPKPDYEKANDLFIKLDSQNGTNGVFLFFRLATESKLHHDSVLVNLLEDLSLKPDFDSYFTRFGMSLQTPESENPTYFLLSIQVSSSMPVPNFSTTKNIILELNKDHLFDREVSKVADLLMKEGLDSNTDDDHWGYSPLQYQTGFLLKNTLQEFREGVLDFRQIAETKPGYLKARELRTGIPFIYVDNCDRTDWDKYFFEHRYEL